jgi:hypothetical protein
LRGPLPGSTPTDSRHAGPTSIPSLSLLYAERRGVPLSGFLGWSPHALTPCRRAGLPQTQLAGASGWPRPRPIACLPTETLLAPRWLAAARQLPRPSAYCAAPFDSLSVERKKPRPSAHGLAPCCAVAWPLPTRLPLAEPRPAGSAALREYNALPGYSPPAAPPARARRGPLRSQLAPPCHPVRLWRLGRGCRPLLRRAPSAAERPAAQRARPGRRADSPHASLASSAYVVPSGARMPSSRGACDTAPPRPRLGPKWTGAGASCHGDALSGQGPPVGSRLPAPTRPLSAGAQAPAAIVPHAAAPRARARRGGGGGLGGHPPFGRAERSHNADSALVCGLGIL